MGVRAGYPLLVLIMLHFVTLHSGLSATIPDAPHVAVGCSGFILPFPKRARGLPAAQAGICIRLFAFAIPLGIFLRLLCIRQVIPPFPKGARGICIQLSVFVIPLGIFLRLLCNPQLFSLSQREPEACLPYRQGFVFGCPYLPFR